MHMITHASAESQKTLFTFIIVAALGFSALIGLSFAKTVFGATGNLNTQTSHKKGILFDSASSDFRTIAPGYSAGTIESTMSLPHTTSGTDRMLFVTVAASESFAATADAVTGVTYAGVPMTLVGKVAVVDSAHAATPIEEYLYYLVAPAVGTNDIAVSYAPSGSGFQWVWIAGTSYAGVLQSAPDTSAVSADNLIASSISGTVTTLSRKSWVVMASYSGDGNTSAGSDTTIRSITPVLARAVLSDNMGAQRAPSSNVTLTINGNNDRVGSIITAIAPAN